MISPIRFCDGFLLPMKKADPNGSAKRTEKLTDHPDKNSKSIAAALAMMEATAWAEIPITFTICMEPSELCRLVKLAQRDGTTIDAVLDARFRNEDTILETIEQYEREYEEYDRQKTAKGKSSAVAAN